MKTLFFFIATLIATEAGAINYGNGHGDPGRPPLVCQTFCDAYGVCRTVCQ